MKVVMIYGNPIGDFYGGILTHVNYLSKNLSNFKDIELTVLTFGDNNISNNKNDINYIEIKKMKYGNIFYPIEIFYDLFRLEQIIKKINPDVIHIQSTGPNFLLFGKYMKKKYPILITIHGYFNEEYKIHTGWRRIVYRLYCAKIEKYALAKLPYIIVLTPQMKDIVSKITNSRIITISNGVDLKLIQKITAYEKKKYPAIFFLGYLTKGKGVQDLIRAIQLVKKEVKNVKLFIGGPGQYMPELKELVNNLGLNENVIFLGFLNEQEKFAYMKSIDIFVLPSYWESFPFVLLEAIACGKPIIATNVGGNPFAVSDKKNGFLVEPGDWKQIANHIINLLNDRNLLYNMGQESKKKSNDFKWEIIAKKTRESYKEIISVSN